MANARRFWCKLVGASTSTRSCSSSSYLFVSKRDSKVHGLLTPTPNLTKTFADVDKLQENIDARRLNVKASDLFQVWKFYKELEGVRQLLEQRRTEVADEIKLLKRNGDPKNETEGKKILGRIIRDDIKNLMPRLWEVEESMMVKCLRLPNELHSDTPAQSSKIIAECGQPKKISKSRESHISLGNQIIDFRSIQSYYLKGDAAIFDLALVDFFHDRLKTDNYISIASPDFVAPAIVEGCGTEPTYSIRLENEDKYLVGGPSLAMFCTFYAKQKIPSGRPLKHVSSGRCYSLSDGPGLFGALQRTAVNFCILSSSASECQLEFHKSVSKLIEVYKELDWPVRVVYTPAPSLQFWESLRASFEMFVPSQDGWKEIGHVSLSGTFISERLSIECEQQKEESRFAHIVSGRAIDVTSSLACLIENGDNILDSTALKSYVSVYGVGNNLT